MRRATDRRDGDAPGSLALFPCCAMVVWCIAGEFDFMPRPLLVNDSNLSSEGIEKGTVLAARTLKAGERPRPGSLCIVRVGRTSYAKFVRFTRRYVYLADDTGEARFHPRELEVRAAVVYACECDRLGRQCEPKFFERRPTPYADALDWPEVIAG
jgi:hypothetical protein